MRKHPVQEQLATDLTAALIAFHSKTRGRNAEAQDWKEIYTAAELCGYNVSVLDINLVVVTEIRNTDKDLNDRWNRNRDLYFARRAILMNNPDPNYISRWAPSSDDAKIMKDLGITWSIPQQTAEPKHQEALSSRRPRQQDQLEEGA